MRLHVAGHWLKGHRWAFHEQLPIQQFCHFCGFCDGKCQTTVMGAKVQSTSPLAHEQLTVIRAQKDTKTNSCTNVPMKCTMHTCGKCVCSYVIGDHIQEIHTMGSPAPLMLVEERGAVLAAVLRGHTGRIDSLFVPVPEITASSHVLATGIACSKNGSSGSSNSSSSGISSNSSSNNSSNNTNSTSSSEFVPSDVGDVLPQQVVTRRRATSKAIGKEKKGRRFGKWENGPEPTLVVKRRPPSEVAADRPGELQEAQRRAQWTTWTTYVYTSAPRRNACADWATSFLSLNPCLFVGTDVVTL